MWGVCRTCLRHYNDEVQNTICPHNPLWCGWKAEDFCWWCDLPKIALGPTGNRCSCNRPPKYLTGEMSALLDHEAERGNFERVGGDALCPVCSHPYRIHAQLYGMPTFHATCGGKVVKT